MTTMKNVNKTHLRHLYRLFIALFCALFVFSHANPYGDENTEDG